MIHPCHLTAALLVGGLGTRLRPVIADRPKALAELHGRPFLTYLLDHLHDQGVRDAVLCTGHLADMIEETLGDRYRSVRLRYSRELDPLGTGGALRLALPGLASDPVLVLNGDSFIPFDLAAHLRFFSERRAEAAMLLARVEDVRRFGQVATDDQDRVTRFVEKGSQTISNWINAGVYLLRRRILRAIPPDVPHSLEREILPALVGKGLFGQPHDGEFIDIGTPESFSQGHGYFAGIA
jgi:D-glycero-alpha-D-manno-heptose 1-phosphate guanylyltransferase